MANQNLMADGMLDSMIESKVKLRSKLGMMESSPQDTSLSLDGPRHRDSRMNNTNIIGMGVGEKESGGAMSGEMAIRVYVRQKADMSDIDDRFRVPPEIDGFKTDVIIQNDMIAHAVHSRREEFPIPCGSSIGSNRTTGTLGALVQMQTGHLAMLSNNHVLATLMTIYFNQDQAMGVDNSTTTKLVHCLTLCP
jgi:hypothetical protein